MLEAARKKEILVFLNMLQTTLSLLKKYQLETEFQFNPQNPLYTVTGYAAVKKGNTDLAEAVKQGMNLITPDERAFIERKWLNVSSVKTEDTLVISVSMNISPFMFLNAEGKPSGMFADIWRLWAQKTGKKIEFLPADTWKTGIENVKNRRADFHGGLFYMPDQYEGISFSQPFYETGVSISVSTKTGKISGITGLSGQTIGAVRGTAQERYLKQTYPNIHVAEFDTRQEMIYAARDGKTGGFISITVLGHADLSQLGLSGEFESLPEILYTGRFCAGVLKENKELLALIDKGFDAISDKELAEIEKRWIPDPEKRYFRPDMKKVRLTAAEHAWISTVKTVKFGFVEEAPPVSFIENNEYRGFHTDFLRLISERTGIRFEYVPVVQPEFDAGAKAHDFDIFPSFNVSARRSFSDFTHPIMEITSVIITRNDEPFISNISTLKGKEVAVLKGFGLNRVLFDKYPEIRFTEKKSALEVLEDVSNSKADATVLPTILACWMIQEHHLINLRIAGVADHPPEPYMYAVRNDYPELFSIVSKAVDSITEDERGAIVQKWLTVQVEHKADWSEIRHWALGIGSVFILLLGISFFWNRRLSKEVKERRQAEAELKKSEIRYRNLFDYCPIALLEEDYSQTKSYLDSLRESGVTDFRDYFRKNPEEVARCMNMSKILKVNRRLLEFFGAADKAGFLEKLPRIFGRRSLATMTDMLISMAEGSRKIEGEAVVNSQIRGQLMHILIRSFNMPESEEDFSKIIIGLIDITERKLAEESLQQAHAHLNATLQALPDILFEVDPDGRIYAFHSSRRELLYVQPESFLSKTVREVLPTDAANIIDQAIGEAAAGGQHSGASYMLRFPDGPHWFELSIAAKGDPHPPGSRFIMLVRDITDRRLAEYALKESEEKYRNLVENLSDALFMTDTKGIVSYISPIIEKIIGLKPEEITGRHLSEFFHPEDLPLILEKFQKMISGQNAEPSEVRVFHKSGKVVWIRTSSRLNIRNGIISDLQGLISDITDRKQSEEYLKRNEARLQSLLRISQYKTDSTKELLDYALDEAIALTESRIGYIYYYNENTKEFSLNTWSDDVMKECSVTKPLTLYQLDKTGLWGEAVRQRKAIVINDFQAPHPLKKGYPEGHAALHKFLTVPVFIEGKIVAVIGVANKSSDYDDSDARQLTHEP